MDTRRGRSRRAGAGALLGAAAALAALAAAPAAAGAATRSGVPVEGWSAARASGFWTPARMRSAVPVRIARSRAGAPKRLPGPSGGAPPTRDAGRPPGAHAGAPPGAAAGAPPGAAAAGPPPAAAAGAPPGAAVAGPPPAAAAGAPPPSSTTTPRPVAPHSDFAEVPDPTAPLTRTNGAVFFEFGEELGRCSGTAVDAPNLSVVFTAGHCVHEAGGAGSPWFRGRWTFVPGYRFGQRPFGVFPARWLDATRRWVSEGNENFDVGAAVVGRNERGQRLGAAVGGTRIAFNLPPRQVFDVHGYPAGRPFDGETQRLCSGAAFLGHDPLSFLFPGPLTLGVPCQLTGGASGGGWTIHGDVLNSVTDYGYPEDPATAFGAYFGPEVKRLYQRVARFR